MPYLSMKAKTETLLICATMLVCWSDPDFRNCQNFDQLSIKPRFSNSYSSMRDSDSMAFGFLRSNSPFFSELLCFVGLVFFLLFLSFRFMQGQQVMLLKHLNLFVQVDRFLLRRPFYLDLRYCLRSYFFLIWDWLFLLSCFVYVISCFANS